MPRNLLIAVMTAWATLLPAQDFWEKTNGPHGGRIGSLLAAGPQTLVASVWSVNAYRSVDSGRTWGVCAGVRPQTAITSLLRVPVTGFFYAGTVTDRIITSTDEGAHWSPTGFALMYPVHSLAVDSNGIIYAGCEVSAFPGEPSVYSSSDNGSTWMGRGLPAQTVEALLVTSDTTLFAGTTSGIYRTTASGWIQVLPLSLMNPVNCFAVDGNGHLYAGAQEGVYRSTDQGDTWQHIAARVVEAMTFDDDGELFTGGTLDGLVYRSTDGGNTWSGLPVAAQSIDIHSLIFDHVNGLLAGSWGTGVYRSSDHGSSWKQLSVPSADTRSFAFTGTGVTFAATNGNGVYRSENSGQTWAQAGLPNEFALSVSVTGQGSVLAGTWGDGIFRSTDNGQSWTRVNGGLSTQYIRKLATHPAGAVFAGTWLGGIYRSDDDGRSWSLSGLDSMDVVDIEFRGSDQIFALTDWGFIELWNSADTGRTWTLRRLFQTLVADIEVKEDGTLFAADGSGVLRSTDGGMTWEQGTGFPTDPIVYSLAAARNGDVYAGISALWMRTGGVYRSQDNGLSWHLTGPDLVYTVISLSINDSGYVFAGTVEDGAYRSLSPATRVVETKGEPLTFGLRQNFPNPFNPVTNLQFTVGDPRFIALSVYDVLGRKVATLVNENKRPGTYTVQWGGRDDAGRPVSSGVYLCRLQSGRRTETMKMVLLR